jgi:predicted ribosome quality control (RQC) complex YloA/Tae2 family protein
LTNIELSKKLDNIKSHKIASIRKKISNLKKELASLSKSEELLSDAKIYSNAANHALMQIDAINIYDKYFEFTEGGEAFSVEIPNAKKPTDIPDLLFAKSKKLKKKAGGVEQESENLEGKILFFEKLIEIIKNAKSGSEIDFYLPKPIKNNRQKTDGDIYELVVDGYKVVVGKNSKGNEKILKSAKANDYWFHLKDIPSAHTLLSCQKNEPSFVILEKTARICAEFSLSQKGAFEVDFAKRRDVSPKGGSRAEYVKYKTIKVFLD